MAKSCRVWRKLGEYKLDVMSLLPNWDKFTEWETGKAMLRVMPEQLRHHGRVLRSWCSLVLCLRDPDYFRGPGGFPWTVFWGSISPLDRKMGLQKKIILLQCAEHLTFTRLSCRCFTSHMHLEIILIYRQSFQTQRGWGLAHVCIARKWCRSQGIISCDFKYHAPQPDSG